MEIQGRIIKISPTQTVGQNGFQRRDVVISTEEQYPQYIPFDFVQEKCVLLDNFQVGQLVRISFNIRGREWVNPQGETKYIVNLQGWRIENAEVAQGAYPPPQGQYPPQGATCLSATRICTTTISASASAISASPTTIPTNAPSVSATSPSTGF